MIAIALAFGVSSSLLIAMLSYKFFGTSKNKVKPNDTLTSFDYTIEILKLYDEMFDHPAALLLVASLERLRYKTDVLNTLEGKTFRIQDLNSLYKMFFKVYMDDCNIKNRSPEFEEAVHILQRKADKLLGNTNRNEDRVYLNMIKESRGS